MTRLFAPMAVLVTAAMLFSMVSPASACSCISQTLDERVRLSEAVVLGSVTEVFESDEQPPGDLDARVKVETYYKGAGPADIIVDDPGGDSSCGFLDESDVGRTYVLFLSKQGLFNEGEFVPWDTFTTHLCAGNAPLADNDKTSGLVAELEEFMGPGRAPSEKPSFMPHQVMVRPLSEGNRYAELPLDGPNPNGFGPDSWFGTDDPEDDDAPEAVLWIAAAAVPLAFLGAALVWDRLRKR